MISIAMATYNGDKFLEEQLDSIIKQTYTDWELIICDDCSNDSTWNILVEYENKDKRIKVYRNKRNLGYSKNFEKAISYCTGEFIALADQDDVWLPSHLTVLLDLIDKNDISWACATKIDSQSKPVKGLVWNPGEFNKTVSKYMIFYYIIRGNAFAGNSMLLNKSLFSVNNIFPIPDNFAHDEWFLFVSCFHNGIKWSNESIVTNRRIHSNNVTGISFLPKNRISSFINAVVNCKKRRSKMLHRLEILNRYVNTFSSKECDFNLVRELNIIIKGNISMNLIKKIQGFKLFHKNYKYIYFTQNDKNKRFYRYLSYFLGIL